MSAVAALMELPLDERLVVLRGDPGLVRHVTTLTGTPWYVFLDSPVEYVEHRLREATWGKQKEILRAAWEYERTVVAACHGPGKTHILARLVSWWAETHPAGTAQVVTTAPTWRQVRTLLWPHVRRLHGAHGMLGTIGLAPEWKLGPDLLAFGFSPAEHDEAAAQGIHHPYVLVLIDEAGGISSTRFRSLEGIMSTGFARMVVIGNPPTDNEDSPFEERYRAPNWHAIRISAFDTPNFTGEETGPCSCPIARFEEHSIATHLTTPEWVSGVIEEFGEDSGFYVARVLGEFPHGLTDRTIPWSFIEAAEERDPGELRPKTRCALGVDVASDGGDELAFAVARGFEIQGLGGKSSPENADPMKVALKIREHIEGGSAVGWEGLIAAQRALDPRGRAEVRIDAIGIGWGVAGTVRAWASEWAWPVDVVAVNVAEKPNTAAGQRKFLNKRAEMWWNGREGCREFWRLSAPRRALAQLAGPTYTATSQGLIKIESKEDMRKRGLPSPDQAEAILLAGYDDCGPEPATLAPVEQFARARVPGVKDRRPMQ